MRTWHAIWHQGVTNFHEKSMIFCDNINFCVLNLWHQYLSLHAIIFMCHEVFEVMNSYACVRVLNNLVLICNYDYNINSHFEQGDT
jgi:hypothetical protein